MNCCEEWNRKRSASRQPLQPYAALLLRSLRKWFFFVFDQSYIRLNGNSEINPAAEAIGSL
jgi:hypothetical protein